MNINSWIGRTTKPLSRSWWLGNIAIQYFCAACGAGAGLMFIIAFIVAGFIPPPKPTWEAEHIAQHYRDNITRIRAGGAILMISGGFYLPFSSAISNQMRRIPNLPYLIHQMQLASAAAGVWTFILPGVVLCVTSFRPDRPAEITQALNDFFWIVALMPWPTFIVQNFAFAYAIIMDQRERPLFPKWLIPVNVIVPILFTFATGMHTTMTGPFAWNGVLTFYVVGFTFVVQLIVDGIYLALSAREEERRGGVHQTWADKDDIESANESAATRRSGE